MERNRMTSSAVLDDFEWGRTKTPQPRTHVSYSRPYSQLPLDSTGSGSGSRQSKRLGTINKSVAITDLRKILHMAEELQTINIDNAKRLYKKIMKNPGLKEQAEKEDDQLETERLLFTKLRSGNHELLSDGDLKEMENEKRKLIEENDELKSNSKKERKIIQQLKEEVKQLKADIESKSRQLQKFQEDKKDTSTSLGHQKRKTQKNQIPDLSGPNRPIKLAERYDELYDNGWTDALETLTTVYYFGEENGVRKLLDILMNCYKICQDVADNQMKSLQRTLVNPGTAKKEREEGGGTLDLVEKSTLKALKDFRKEASLSAAKNIYLEHAKDMDHSLLSKIPDYVKKCIELCWFMCVQDPPVVLGSQAVVGERLDTNMFKVYTNSGTVVSYNVWPPLVLHEGGPLLRKGIVQPMKEERKPKPVLDMPMPKSTRYQVSSKTVQNALYGSNAYEDYYQWRTTKEPPPRNKEEPSDRQFSEWPEPYQRRTPSRAGSSPRYRQTYLNEERNERYYDNKKPIAPASKHIPSKIMSSQKKEKLFKFGDNLN